MTIHTRQEGENWTGPRVSPTPCFSVNQSSSGSLSETRLARSQEETELHEPPEPETVLILCHQPRGVRHISCALPVESVGLSAPISRCSSVGLHPALVERPVLPVHPAADGTCHRLQRVRLHGSDEVGPRQQVHTLAFGNSWGTSAL